MKKWIFLFLLLVFLVTIANAQTVQVSCLTSTTTIDTADSARVASAIQNLDTTNFVFICLEATCTATTGIRLDPGTTNGKNAVTFNRHEYRGALSCIADTTTVVITFTEVPR